MPTLLYHTGALGDFITTIPALRLWKKKRPADRFTLLGRPPIADLARDAGLIDEAWDIDSPLFVPLFREDFSLAAAELFSGFDAAIVFAAASSPLLANLRRSGIAELHSQPPFPSGSGVHAIDYHLSLFADPATMLPMDKLPRLSPSADALARSQEMFPAATAPVALHPGSGSRLKNWPFERYVELAERLRNRGSRIAWIAGPAESVFDVAPGDSIVKDAPLPLLAAFFSRCKLFIGNDSGVAHLAASVGCPAVAIFGPSDPAIWAPRGQGVHIVNKNSVCAPCHLRKNFTMSCDRACLDRITIDDVLSAGEQLVDSKQSNE